MFFLSPSSILTEGMTGRSQCQWMINNSESKRKNEEKKSVQSNLDYPDPDYPDPDYPDYSIIRTFFSGPNFSMNIN